MRLPEKVFAQPEFASMMSRFQFIYSMTGLILGLAFALLGMALCLHGVASASGWVVQLLGLKSSLFDAPPGVVLFVAGLMVVFITRFDVRAVRVGRCR